MTQTTNPLAVYYNKDIFAQYDLQVPTTEEEFLAVCKTLKDNGVVPLAEGAGVNWIPEFLIEGMLANSCDDITVFGSGKLRKALRRRWLLRRSFLTADILWKGVPVSRKSPC